MTSTKTFALSALAGLLALSGAAQASSLSMKPLHGVSFDAGSQRAVSYFLAEPGRCKLVVTLAGEPEDNATFTATRFEAAIGAGTGTRYTSSEGKAFDFACAADAQAMTINPVQQFADVAGE